MSQRPFSNHQPGHPGKHPADVAKRGFDEFMSVVKSLGKIRDKVNVGAKILGWFKNINLGKVGKDT